LRRRGHDSSSRVAGRSTPDAIEFARGIGVECHGCARPVEHAARQMETMQNLARKDRLRLMKFVCSFAWADLEIRPEERRFISDMVVKLDLDDEDRQKVVGWLEVPPEPDAIDPTLIPHAHRQLFVDAIKGVIAADGDVAPEEHENLALLEQLLA
jgi:hypothetical protein